MKSNNWYKIFQSAFRLQSNNSSEVKFTVAISKNPVPLFSYQASFQNKSLTPPPFHKVAEIHYTTLAGGGNKNYTVTKPVIFKRELFEWYNSLKLCLENEEIEKRNSNINKAMLFIFPQEVG